MKYIKKSVIIDMDMPKDCADCRYCDRGSEMDRFFCRLTKHDFPSSEGRFGRFETCPLKECK